MVKGLSRLLTVLMVGTILVPVLPWLNPMVADGQDGSFGGGDGTLTNPYVIEDAWDLQNMSSDLDAHYVLGNEIDASLTLNWNSGAGFLPIGTVSTRFTGSLDGRNHTIYNLFINRSTMNFVGLFGYIDTSGSVKNVGLMENNVTGKNYVGGLVGCSEGTVVFSFSTGNVKGNNSDGGLMGSNSGYVTNSFSVGRVIGHNDVGGLVGKGAFSGWIINSYSVGNVTGVDNVGGLVGSLHLTHIVKDSYAAGDVTGNSSVGGLVGNIHEASINRSYATGNVTGNSSVGGLVGYQIWSAVSDSYSMGEVVGRLLVGGLVGTNYGSNVHSSYSKGNVSGTDDKVGGLVGWVAGGMVRNSYATGTVIRLTGTNAGFGGFVGSNYQGRILKCYSTGVVAYKDAISPNDKGFAAQVTAEGEYEMVGNFWDIQTSWQTDSSGNATGMNTQEMKTRSTFTNASWDFKDVWCIKEGITYPLLKWQDGGYPFSDAGPDQIIDEDNFVTFDGRESSDIVGIANYTWTFMDVGIVSLFGVQPKYLFNNPGVFLVTLVVMNTMGNWIPDTMTVTVNDTTVPIADAGPDQTLDEGTTVTFDGSGSSDNLGIVNWTWSFSYGAIIYPIFDGQVLLYGETPQFPFMNPGLYNVSLTVRDAAGHSASDIMTVLVRDVQLPLADAGPDTTVDEGMEVKFSGANCYDCGGIENYTWTFNYGAEKMALHGWEAYFTFDVPGTYVVTLKVTDFAGHSSTDTLNVTVVDVIPPLADAGPDQSVNEGSTVTFDGSGSLDSGGIAGYMWTFDLGTGPVVLHGASPSFRFDVPGIYVVTLNVTDAAGHWTEDMVTITVRDTTPPVAKADPSLEVPIGGEAYLDGSRSTDNVGIAGYTWTFTYDGRLRTLNGSAARFTFGSAGTYEVVLTVVDGAGNDDACSVMVTVVVTGRVTGTVLDRDGRPVGGAEVRVVASDGESYTRSTSEDGSFVMDVFHGAFEWTVSKRGYRPLSGDSSVEPMGVRVLDLTDRPLEREDEGSALFMYLTPLLIAIAVVVILVKVVAWRKRQVQGP